MPIISVKAAIEVIGFVIPEPILLELGVDEFTYPGSVTVAADATYTVSFSEVTTASFVFIRCNSAYTFNLNANGSVTMQSGGYVILFNTSVTSLVIIETASAEMQAEVILGGT